MEGMKLVRDFGDGSGNDGSVQEHEEQHGSYADHDGKQLGNESFST